MEIASVTGRDENENKVNYALFSKALLCPSRAKIHQVDATLFVEQRLNNVVIKVQQHLLN